MQTISSQTVSNCPRLLIILFSSDLSPRQTLMLRLLKTKGWHIFVIAWDRVCKNFKRNKHNDIVDRWYWVRVPAPSWSLGLIRKLPSFYYQTLKIVGKLNNIDVCFVTHLFLLPLVFFLPGKKVYDAAEMYALDISFYFRFFRRKIQIIISFLEGLLVTRVDGILTVDSRNGWLANFYRRRNKLVQVIWNVPSKYEEPNQNEVENLNSIYSGRKVVAFIGGLMKEKGLRVAIESVSLVKQRYPDVLFLFIGLMKDNSEEINTIISDRGLQNNVRFLGPMSYTQMLTHLRYAQIGLALHQKMRIYPYLSAGNGRKFFTYMQAGVAIIGPNFGEVGKIVSMTDCGLLVDTERAEAVAEAIDYLFSHPEEMKRMADNGRKAFLERFNWEVEEKKFLNFLKQVGIL
jgi:glycosyltransferase involved in cell wall biosynthesis